MNTNGNSKILYLIITGLGALILLILGAFVNHIIYGDSALESAVTALSARVGSLEVQGATKTEKIVDLQDRLAKLENERNDLRAK